MNEIDHWLSFCKFKSKLLRIVISLFGRYFSCQSPKERDEWIASLKKTLMMNEDRRRTDNSLRLDVLEVKGLPEKKKYYAEILVDDKLYARTSAKKLTSQCCFWGEQFEFKVRC